MRSSKTQLIGYAWHTVPTAQPNSVMDQFAYHIAMQAETKGYHMLTFTANMDNPLPVYDELIRTRRLDGFIIAETIENDPRIELLLSKQFPFVSFGRVSDASKEFCWVDTDAYHGAYQAVEHLVKYGHRRIGIISWQDPTSVTRRFRMKGFFDAAEKNGLNLAPSATYEGKHGIELGRQALHYWLGLEVSERPTGIFAMSDLEAIGFMSEAESAGMVIGQDFSIIGFDDIPLLQYIRPRLTTFRQPIADISTAMLDTLTTLIDNKIPAHQQLLIQPELVERDSVGQAPD
ncbi:LacI family DNA-binding transcriptional regulator [Anaerolineales bacterium]